MDPLQNLREELDSIDDHLIETLGQRFTLCRRIAERKAALDIPMMQPARIEKAKARAAAGALKYGLSESFMQELYQLIIAEACRIETDLMEKAGEQ